MYGHVYKMAQAIVEGAKQVPGAEVALYQVSELVPDDELIDCCDGYLGESGSR